MHTENLLILLLELLSSIRVELAKVSLAIAESYCEEIENVESFFAIGGSADRGKCGLSIGLGTCRLK